MVADQPADRETLECVECGRAPRADENADDDWRVESDDVGELHVVCPECRQREFGAGDGSDRTGEGRCDG